MAKIHVPFELPTAGGAGYRPVSIPERPGFGGPPAQYPLPEGYHSPLATLPDWFRFDPQVTVGKDGLSFGESAKITGTPGAEVAENVTMESDVPAINGFVVKDDCKYTLKNCRIDLKGDGVDDFAGYSAGLQAAGSSTVIMEDTTITTAGVIRPCTSAT